VTGLWATVGARSSPLRSLKRGISQAPILGRHRLAGVEAGTVPRVKLQDSRIVAQAREEQGGRINIVADVFLSNNSIVDASSERGISGTVDVQAQVTDVSGGLARLPETVTQAGELLRASCAARLAAGKASSLGVAGREGVPPEPDGFLWSPLLVGELAGTQVSLNADDRWETFPRFSAASLDPKCRR
jgi:hypothetical protein